VKALGPVAEIEIIRTQDPLREAAERLTGILSSVDAQSDGARLAIPGGSALGAVGMLRARLDVEAWKRLRLTWVDERCASFANPDSNRGAAYRSGVLDSAWPPAVELPLFLDGEGPAMARRRVEAGLRREFAGALDVLLLGIGEDGHIASLFPGRDWLPAPALVQSVTDSPKQPSERISLTLSLLRTAPWSILVALGEGKREALDRLLMGDPALPASALKKIVVVTDLGERETVTEPDDCHGLKRR
jgi:6-phosphogluconolactonase